MSSICNHQKAYKNHWNDYQEKCVDLNELFWVELYELYGAQSVDNGTQFFILFQLMLSEVGQNDVKVNPFSES